jgi:hypothetical protein
MFEIKNDLIDLKVKERNIFKILYSMNSHPVATPGMNVEEARCYILFFSEGSNLSAFIGLYLPRTDRKLFYAYSSNPFPVEGEADVESDARVFAEDMGFLLDEINVAGMAGDDRNHWIEEQYIFGYRKPEAEETESELNEEPTPEAEEEEREPEVAAAKEEPAPQPEPPQATPAPSPSPVPQPEPVVPAPVPAPEPAAAAPSIWPEPEPAQAAPQAASAAHPAPQAAPPHQPVPQYPQQQQQQPMHPQGQTAAQQHQSYPQQYQPPQPPYPQQYQQPVPSLPGQPPQQPVPELDEPIMPQRQPAPPQRKPQPAPAQKKRPPAQKPLKPAARAEDVYEETVPVEMEIEAAVSRQNVLGASSREEAAKRAKPKPAGRTGAVTRDKEALARLLASF